MFTYLDEVERGWREFREDLEAGFFDAEEVEEDEDWQGDSFYLVQDAFGRVGYLQFGWGRCSGCDALQACDDNIHLLTGLRDDLYSEIKWFDTRAEALEWFKSHDWEGDWVYHSGAGMAFVEEATKLLSEHVPAV